MERVMATALRAATQRWIQDEHLRNVLEGEWLVMYDSDGRQLDGIRGRIGAIGIKADGTDVGVDCIEMQPGSSFAPHVHDGDHILFIESGIGSVLVDGVDRSLKKGDSVFIQGGYPHAVTGPPLSEQEPLVIIAFGHPHKDVSAKDRMKHPSDHHHEH